MQVRPSSVSIYLAAKQFCHVLAFPMNTKYWVVNLVVRWLKSCERLKSLNENIILCCMDNENEDEYMIIGGGLSDSSV